MGRLAGFFAGLAARSSGFCGASGRGRRGRWRRHGASGGLGRRAARPASAGRLDPVKKLWTAHPSAASADRRWAVLQCSASVLCRDPIHSDSGWSARGIAFLCPQALSCLMFPREVIHRRIGRGLFALRPARSRLRGIGSRRERGSGMRVLRGASASADCVRPVPESPVPVRTESGICDARHKICSHTRGRIFHLQQVQGHSVPPLSVGGVRKVEYVDPGEIHPRWVPPFQPRLAGRLNGSAYRCAGWLAAIGGCFPGGGLQGCAAAPDLRMLSLRTAGKADDGRWHSSGAVPGVRLCVCGRTVRHGVGN